VSRRHRTAVPGTGPVEEATMRNTARWAIGLGVLALVTAGCGAGDDSADGGAAADNAAAAVAAPAPAGSAAGAGTTADRAGTVTLEPQLVRTAELDVEVDDVAGRAGEAAAAVRAAGGAVAGDDRSGTGDGARATLVLKVPPGRMDGLVDRLAGLGAERKRSSTTEDVTEDVADVGARVATMRASIARVRAILSRAQRIGDVVAVEGELSRRVTELESLEARQRALSGRTQYATVTLGLTARTAATPPPAERGGFVGGLADGWDAFTATVGGLLVVLGVVLPFLLVVVPVAVAARWATRRRTRPAPAPPAA
jgi:hypothetical protein